MFLYIVVVCVGGGTLISVNLGQMAAARGNSGASAACASLFSVAQCIGRVSTGLVSDSAVRHGFARPWVLAGAAGFMAIAQLLLGFAPPTMGFLLLGLVVAGVAFGAFWPLMVCCTGELFGMIHFGANYCVYDGCSTALGTFLFGKLLAQSVYEAHVGPDGRTCIGSSCFASAHAVSAALSVSAVLGSVMLARRSRAVYAQLAAPLPVTLLQARLDIK